MKNEEDEKIVAEFLTGNVPLKALSWLHNLLLILQSSQLTMLDL